MLDRLRGLLSPDLRYRIDGWMADGTFRARAYSPLRSRFPLLIGRETDVVIEGFPRSANTYAYLAFRVANGEELSIAHHNHAGVSVRLGVKRAIPVVVVLRHPLDAAASWLQYRPEISARSALRAYIRFYEIVARRLDHVVVAPFETVISDFSKVVSAVNERFGTSYLPYEATEENEARIRHEVEWWDYVVSGHTEIREHTVSRPSSERAARKEDEADRLRSQHRLLARAEDLYSRIMASNAVAGAPQGEASGAPTAAPAH